MADYQNDGDSTVYHFRSGPKGLLSRRDRKKLGKAKVRAILSIPRDDSVDKAVKKRKKR